jgi:hypothetical protein
MVLAGVVDVDMDRRLAEVEFVSCAYSLEEAWCDATTTSNTSTHSAGDCVQKDIQIHRRLDLAIPDNMENGSVGVVVVVVVPVCLTLTLPPFYPTLSALRVNGKVVMSAGDKPTNIKTGDLLKLQKVVYATLPQLVHSCRHLAMEHVGEEAVFLVLHHAEEWIQTKWPELYREQQQQAAAASKKNTGHQDDDSPSFVSSSYPLPPSSLILGRRLIFSHHIISKIKRRDIHDLVKHHRLTGYMKIGWPGILLIEGAEEDCIAFYDTIRPWQWQYLVVRGEQQETVPSRARGDTTPRHQNDNDSDCDALDRYRKFQTFQEVEDLSPVAQHCREVGLEALFQTSMKNFKNDTDNNHNDNRENNNTKTTTSTASCWYGALVRVDHMNHGKAYRKWLRKTSQETDCYLLIKEYCPSSLSSSSSSFVGGSTTMTTTMSSSSSERSQEVVKNDNHSKYSSSCSSDNNNNKASKKKNHRSSYSIIVVGIRAKDSKNVSNFLKRWRISRVDIDATGKPCLERQMSILVEGSLTLFHDATSSTRTVGAATTTGICDDNDNNTSTSRRNDSLVAAALEHEVRVSSLEELGASVLFMGGEAWQAAILLQGPTL